MAVNSCAFWSIDAALGVASIIHFCPHDCRISAGGEKIAALGRKAPCLVFRDLHDKHFKSLYFFPLRFCVSLVVCFFNYWL